MRVFNFSIVALGIMFFLLVGGIETNSGQIINGIFGDGPSVWENTIFWAAILAAFTSFLATNRIAIGGFSFQASVPSIMAFVAGALYILFMADIMSIAAKIYSIECIDGATILTCGSWEYLVVLSVVLVMGLGYGISLIQFIGGSD